MYYSFSITKLQKYKENFSKIKFFINRIFTPESIKLSSVTFHENYDAKIMTRKL